MRSTAIFIVTMILLSTVVSAADLDLSDLDFTAIKDGFNQNIENLPWAIRALAGSEKLNVEVAMKDGSTQTISVTTHDGEIVSMSNKAVPDPSFVLELSELQVVGIMGSDNPIQYIQENVGDEGIKVEAISIIAKIKLFIINVGMWLLSMFTGTGNFIRSV